MTFSTTYEASAFINRTHSRFAGKSTLPRKTNPNSFGTLMRARDYLKEEPAAVSIDFEAVMDCGYPYVDTIVTMTPVDDDGWLYVERPVSK